MQINERFGHLAEHGDGIFGGKGASIETIGERASGKILHDVVRRFGVPPDLEKVNDPSLAENLDELSHFSFEKRPIEAFEP
jgi:hypothetical protein